MSDPIWARVEKCIVDDSGDVWQIIDEGFGHDDPWPVEMVHDNPWPGLYYPGQDTLEPKEGKVVKVEEGTETDNYVVVNGCWEFKRYD